MAKKKKKSAIANKEDLQFSMKMSANLKSMYSVLKDISIQHGLQGQELKDATKSNAKLLVQEKARYKQLDDGEKKLLNKYARREQISAIFDRQAQGFTAETDDTLALMTSVDAKLTSAAKTNRNLLRGAQQSNEFMEEREKILERIEAVMLNDEGLTEDDIKNQIDLLHTSLEQLEAAEDLEKVNKRIEQIQEGTASLFGYSRDEVEGMVTKFEDFVANPMTAAIAGAFLLLNYFKGLVSEAMELRAELGVSSAEALHMQNSIDSVARSFSMLGVSAEDVKGTAESLSQEFGGHEILTRKTLQNVVALQATFGIAGGDAASLLKQMEAMGSASMETNIATLETAASLAQAAGVAPAEVMADVAENTETFAKFGKDGGKNVLKAAIAAKKLGVSMTEISKAAESIMDIESSIASEMEASVLLGRQVNMNKAREAVMAGDLEAAQKEIVNQLGSANEWNKMNYYQRQALASAAGMEVEEVSKMIANQEKLNETSGLQKANMDIIAKILEHMGRAFQTLVDLAKMLIVPLGVMTIIFLGWKGILGASILGIVIALLSAFQELGPVGKTITGVILGMAAAAWMWHKNMFGGGGIKDMLGGFKKLGTMIGGLGAKITGLIAPTTALNTATGGQGVAGAVAGGGKMNMATIAKGVGILILLALGIGILGLALQTFAGISWADVFIGLGALVAFGAVAFLISLLAGPIAIGAAVILLLGLAIMVFGFGLQAVAKGIGMMGNVLSTISGSITQLTGVAGDIMLLGTAFASLGMSMFSLGAGLAFITPFLPTLMALAAIGGLAGGTVSAMMGGEGEGADSESELGTKLDKVNSNLQTLINLYQEGGIVQLDSYKVGKVLGKQITKPSIA